MTTEVRSSAGHGSAFQPGTDAAQQVGVTLAKQTDAAILIGGQGTRLRPLTVNVPKSMLSAAGHPFLEHLLGRIRAVGMKHVVLSTSYRTEVFEEHSNDGSDLGLEIGYVFEAEPLGTGGGIRDVLDKLRYDTAMIFNGDVLGDTGLRAVLGTRAEKSANATIHPIRVPDPRAFGCVPTDEDGRVLKFLEKTQDPLTDQIDAGIYVLRCEIIESIPAGRPISVECEISPALLDRGMDVHGHVDYIYWRDMGTPGSFVRGSPDLVRGIAPSPPLEGKHDEVLVDESASVGGGTLLYGGSVVGRGVETGAGTRIGQSVVFDSVRIGASVVVERSVIADGADISPRTVISGAIINEGAVVGARCELINDIRV